MTQNYTTHKYARQVLTVLLLVAFLFFSCFGLTGCKKSGVADGTYQVNVTLEGGSGRASVESPCTVTVKNGECTATLIWSSSHYDYMVVDGKTYEPTNTEGNSTFDIPIDSLNCTMEVQADTTAMSTPHLIDYTLTFSEEDLPKSGTVGTVEIGETKERPIAIEGLTYTKSMDLEYAEQFAVDYYSDGYAIIEIGKSQYFLLVPKGKSVPKNLDSDIVVLQQPLDQVYLVASSAMDLFRELDALDIITMTGTTAADWSIPEIQAKVKSGDITYAGKYSAPDYETILSKGCDLAIESTMIYHTPEVKEKLETLNIPVMVERSSYESDPLGRVEWIRLYGLLSGKEAEADAFMKNAEQRLATVKKDTKGGSSKTVAFFYISSNGTAHVRRPGDYITKMISLAGGSYVFDSLDTGDSTSSTVNMQMETFYATAKDADILIYNSTVETEISTLNELLSKSSLLKDFKAVKEGNVWCTNQNMFQQTTGTVDTIEDFHAIVTGAADGKNQLTYLHRLT